MEIAINCKFDEAGSDRIEVSRDHDGDIRFRTHGDTVFTDATPARAFARKLLELVGDEPGTADVKIGDLVEVTKDRHNDTSDVGRRGRLTKIDDDDLPYRVELPDGDFLWVMEVRKVTDPAPTTAPSPFAAHIDEAKRLLAGTTHTGADVIHLAVILAR